MTCMADSVLDYDTYRRQSYAPALDGLRAVCVLIVISVHMYDANTMWTWLAGSRGVTIFFILSGYLITLLGLREESTSGRVALAAFYVRRSCRIFPLYFFTLGIYCVLILVLNLAPLLQEAMWRALPYYVLYLQEVPFYAWVVIGRRDVPFFHSWSLGVEEKFYLLWPWLAFVLWREASGKRIRGTFGFLMMLALAQLVLGLLPGGKALGRWLFSFASILAGCLLAMLLHDRGWFARLQRLVPWTAVIGIAFLFCHFATPWVGEPTLVHGLNVLYLLSATGLLACIVLGRGLLQSFLSHTPLVFVGKLSYGIYLIHVLCLVVVYRYIPASNGQVGLGLLAFGLTCALTTLAAWILALILERPAIEWGRQWSRRLLAGQQPSPQPAFIRPALPTVQA